MHLLWYNKLYLRIHFEKAFAICSKRYNAYYDDESVNKSDKQIPRFASLKNDDDYDSDNKDNMPMQEMMMHIFKTSIQTMKNIVM